MKIKIDALRYLPIYEPADTGPEVEVPEPTLARWQHVLREFDQVQEEMSDLRAEALAQAIKKQQEQAILAAATHPKLGPPYFTKSPFDRIERRYFTEAELRERAAKEGWAPEFLEVVLKAQP